MTKIYAIRNKETGEFVKFGSKCAWAGVGPAKNAFIQHCHLLGHEYVGWFLTFESQYEIVDLTEAYYRLEGLMK